eukprot:192530_1
MNNNQIPCDWIPYLKLNSILKEFGCVIKWTQMQKIKQNREKYMQCVSSWQSDNTDDFDAMDKMYDKSAFIFDFHCGPTSRGYINIEPDILLIENIYFSAAECDEFIDKYRCNHRCLRGHKHRFKGRNDSPYFFCGKHDLFLPEHHSCFSVKTEKVRVETCGWDHCFKDNFDVFLSELIDEINMLARKHQEDKNYVHLDISKINWNTYDIECYPLRKYLHDIEEKSENIVEEKQEEKDIEIISRVVSNGRVAKKRRL